MMDNERNIYYEV